MEAINPAMRARGAIPPMRPPPGLGAGAGAVGTATGAGAGVDMLWLFAVGGAETSSSWDFCRGSLEFCDLS